MNTDAPVMQLPRTGKLPKTHPRPTDEIRRKMRADFVAGKGSGGELARKYNVSHNTVSQWIWKGGWQAMKDKREEREEGKLNDGFLPTEDAVPLEMDRKTPVQKLEAHLLRIDQMLGDEMDAKNIAQLSRARKELAEQLQIALHGGKAPTLKPVPRRSSRNTIQLVSDPVPVAVSPDPGTLLPGPALAPGNGLDQA